MGMGLRMKSFNIMGFDWKMHFFEGGGGGVMKNKYKEGIARKEGLGQFADLRGLKNRGWSFWGEVDTQFGDNIGIQLGVSFHMSITLWYELCSWGVGGGGGGAVSLPLALFCYRPLFCYIYYFAIYFIL